MKRGSPTSWRAPPGASTASTRPPEPSPRSLSISTGAGGRGADQRASAAAGQAPAAADGTVGQAEQRVHENAEDQDHDDDGGGALHVGLILVGGKQYAERRLVRDDDEQFARHQAAPGERPALLEPSHERRQRGRQDQVPVQR